MVWGSRWSIKRAAVTVMILMLLMLAGCGGGGGDTGGGAGSDQPPAAGEAPSGETAEKGGRLVIARVGGVDTLDPARTVAGPAHEVFRLIYDTLVTPGPDGSFQGQLAERWEPSEDGLSWTFHLRQDRVFSNGNPVNADAVVFTFQRILDPDAASPTRPLLGPVTGVEKVDDYTVRFVLERPFALLLDNLSIEYFGIVDPQAVEEFGDDFGRNPVGSGPFMLKEWVTGDRMVLVPNPRHQTARSDVVNQGAPYVEELVFRDIPQIETQLAALRSGEVNLITNLPPEQAVTFQGDPAYQVLTAQSGTNISYLSFGMQPAQGGGRNVFKPPFDDIRVRQAVAHAVDAEAILENVLYGFAVRNKTPMPSGNFGYDAGLGENVPDYDPERAAQLLDEAGWAMGPDGVRQKDGTPLHINFWTLNAGSGPQVAQVIQNQLEAVGFDVELTTLDVATYVSEAPRGELDLELLGQGWPAPNILNIMSTIGWGFGLYNDPELADLLARAESTGDDAQRAALYREAQQLILDDMAIVPLYTGVAPIVARAEVKDLKFNVHGLPLYNDVYVVEP